MTSPLQELTAQRVYTPFGVAIKRAVDERAGSFSLEARSVAYATTLVGLAIAEAMALWATGFRVPDVWIVGVLAAVAAIAERSGLPLSGRITQSTAQLPTLFAAVLFGPLAAMLVGASSMLLELRRPYARALAYASSTAITGSLMGLATYAYLGAAGDGIGGITVATVIGATIFEVVDAVFLHVVAMIRGSRIDREFRVSLLSMGLMSVAIYGPVVGLLAYAYAYISAWSLPLFLAPALAAQRLYALYLDQRQLTEDLRAANTRLETVNLSFAVALVATLDARDQYTAGHSAAVAIYARDIAERMGLRREEVATAHLCGLVHDIGKIGLPPGLIEKAGALNLEERRQMERHPEIGERILAKVDNLANVAKIIRHHHERFDGRGYPDGLASDAIPLISRIIGVADAYNAMTSDRPYRQAMPSRVARFRLAQAADSQFDTSVVAAFEAILAGASEEYRTGTRADFDLHVQEAQPVGLSEVA